MSRLPAFLRALAAVDGRPVENLELIARSLRLAGALPPSRRGVGSTPVDCSQAAKLLLAAMSGEPPSGCARAVEVYGSLKRKHRGGFGNAFPSLHVVAKAETFGEAMERLFEHSLKLRAEAVLGLMLLFDKVPPETLLDLDLFTVEVTLQRPVPHASITLRAVDERGLYHTEFTAEWIADASLLSEGFYGREAAPARADRRTSTTITHRTVFRLGDVLAELADDTEQSEELCHA